MGGQGSKVEHPDASEKQRKIKEYHDAVNEQDTEYEISFSSAASKADPSQLFQEFVSENHHPIDGTVFNALTTNPTEFEYPFENLVLEGGGNKGLAYAGVVKCLEDLGIRQQIKRVGGASAGAMSAALIALGFSAAEIMAIMSQDLEEIFVDHSCGYFSLLPNIFRTYGWNPGTKVHEWFGELIARKTDNPKYTFYNLYLDKGIELCVVVTNVNQLTVQYCHPKTTPDMPIRDALRMTMSIPGFYAPMEYDNHGSKDIYVDGGTINNYPINCFDGWYLSMDRKDAFLVKLKRLDVYPELLSNANKFKSRGPNKTMGFLLFEEQEREVSRYRLEKRIGILQPKEPKNETRLWLDKKKKWEEMDQAKKRHCRIANVVEQFLKLLEKHNLVEKEHISKDELKAALNDDSFPLSSFKVLFGDDTSLDKAFEVIDTDSNGNVTFFELMQFAQSRGLRMQTHFYGFGRREVTSLASYLYAISDALFTNLKYTSFDRDDADRTVGINTGHVGGMDYTLTQTDKDFVIERGYNATMSFLRYYAAKYPDQVKKREQSKASN